MRRMWPKTARGRKLTVIAALLGAVLVGCEARQRTAANPEVLQSGLSLSSIDPSDPRVLVFGRSRDSLTLDPAQASDGESAKVIDSIFETLLDFDEDPKHPAKLVANLAIDWTSSTDRMTWTFRLREGVHFHDGTPLDAEAVKFSLDRLIDPKHPFAPARVPYRATFRQIQSVEVLGTLEFRVHMKEPTTLLLSNLAMFASGIVSPTAVRRLGRGFGRAPVGSGPFRFTLWERGEGIILERNDAWWVSAKPSVERLVFVQAATWPERRELLKRGKIHIADNVDVGDLAWLESTRDVHVERAGGMNVCYLAINNEAKPLDQPDVRRAIALCVDRARILRFGYHGAGTIADDLLPGGVTASGQRILPKRDVEAARQIVANSAAALRQPIRLWYMKNQRPYLMDPERVATIVRDCLTDVGLQVEVASFEWGDYLKHLRAGDHQLALMGWTADNGDPDNFYSALLSEAAIGETNYTRLRSTRFEALLAASRDEEDRVVRVALFKRMQDLLSRSCSVVPLVHTNLTYAVRDSIEGFQPHPIRLRLYRVRRKAE